MDSPANKHPIFCIAVGTSPACARYRERIQGTLRLDSPRSAQSISTTGIPTRDWNAVQRLVEAGKVRVVQPGAGRRAAKYAWVEGNEQGSRLATPAPPAACNPEASVVEINARPDYHRSDEIDAEGRAGQRAAQQTAHSEAIGYFTRTLDLLKRLPDSVERNQQELDLQMALSMSLYLARGPGAPEQEPQGVFQHSASYYAPHWCYGKFHQAASIRHSKKDCAPVLLTVQFRPLRTLG